MTEPQSSTMRPEIEAERDRLAAEAFTRIRKESNHWRDWTFIAQGFDAGRNRAMSEARTNRPMGRGYNEAFSRWMKAPHRDWARGVDKATRNHLLWVADHLTEIEAWRDTLAANQRDRMNHPTVIKRAYETAQRVQIAKDEGGAPVLSPMAQLKAALVESQESEARWKRRAEEGGSLFDLRRDTAKEIARVLVGQLTPSKLEAVLKEARAEQKRLKQAHAG